MMLGMEIDDPLLPAAEHLTGPFAADVLRPAVEHAGGSLLSYRCTQVQYRPGHDLVAQFRTEVDWSDGKRRRETIFAATTRTGPPGGSVVVTAETPWDDLTVGVWRWPFDPQLPALESVLQSPAEHLARLGILEQGAALDVDVVAYRPTDRAVLRVRTPRSNWYLKVVRPAGTPEIVSRHRLLFDHGLPVPEVVAADPEQGWMLISELAGPTLRHLIKTDAESWIEPGSFRGLIVALASVDDISRPAFRSRLADAPYHASLLQTVLPEARDLLDPLADFLLQESERALTRPRGFVHGDLHESQLIVADGRITGLLDIDEAGMGDPIDDLAVPVAHLRHRALTAPNGERIDRFVDGVVGACAGDHHPHDIAAGAVAVLVALATAPFRRQSDDWRERVMSVLELAHRQLPPA
jgi:aminoglycoside phosphotransferase (APT) family kinase protein